ncbi:fibrillin-2-like [Wyeomyia smithii]|uniref:fibrillin-2-like n=1 Tax=Wyeomyia smithii TaxID=174621 RepID=UPI002467D468|nr:fibrillin-2-like [Wyeomyia smithii]XP_055550180.1 fibrillin-2-like [Wyeomyia smithii]
MQSKVYLTVLAYLVVNLLMISSFPQASNTSTSPYKDGQRVATELFAFPADQSTIDSMLNARNRTPVYIPEKCLENEILYPGDQDSDWVCDCKPTYVFHPPTRKCYEMYTQGYCENGFMIKLALNAKKPECIPNSCVSDDPKVSMVMFKGTCVVLNNYDPRCEIGQLKRFVGVNETTHELECINITGVKNAGKEQSITLG